MELTLWNVLLLLAGIAIFTWGALMRRRSFLRGIRLGAWLCLTGAVLATIALVLIFNGFLEWLFDWTHMDLWIFTGWARSPFVRWILFVLLLVIAGLSAYIWRVRKYMGHRAATVRTH